MKIEDYAGKVESYICQNDGSDRLGTELSEKMRKTLAGERPLTEEDSKRWINSINFHLESIAKRKRIKHTYIGEKECPVKDIPENLANGFYRDACGWHKQVYDNPIKLIVLDGETPIGFAGANYFKGAICVNSFYLDERYRGNGSGMKILFRLLSRAKREGLQGIDINDMTHDSVGCFERIERRCEKTNLSFDLDWGEDSIYGTIRFPPSLEKIFGKKK